MKTLRYLLALLLVSSLPLFSAFIPDAMATPPSVMLGDAAKSDNEKTVEDAGALQDLLGPFAKALSEDVLKLVEELAKKYKSVGDFTKNFDLKELGQWGKGLEILGRAAALFTQQDPLNFLSFRLNRIAAWTSVTALPPATAGKTLIPAPDGQIISALENLYQSRSWRDLLADRPGFRLARRADRGPRTGHHAVLDVQV